MPVLDCKAEIEAAFTELAPMIVIEGGGEGDDKTIRRNQGQ